MQLGSSPHCSGKRLRGAGGGGALREVRRWKGRRRAPLVGPPTPMGGGFRSQGASRSSPLPPDSAAAAALGHGQDPPHGQDGLGLVLLGGRDPFPFQASSGLLLPG